MNKIIGIIEPFQKQQQIYIYKDNVKVDAVESTIDSLTKDITDLIKKYNISEINLKGPNKFTKKFGNEIFEFTKLNNDEENTIEIKYI